MGKGIRLSDAELEGRVVAGVDTHVDTHWLCVLDDRGRKVLSEEFPADASGYAALAEAIGDPERCAAVGVEGTASYGAALTDELVRRGFFVLEVLNKKKERKRRRGEGKNDEIDAERAARDVIAGDGTSIPKQRCGWVDDLRSLLVARDQCLAAKKKAHAAALSLTRTAREGERSRWRGMSQKKLMRSLLKLGERGASALHRSLLALARSWKANSDEADALEAEMARILRANNPSLLDTYCCGPVNAAELAVAAGENPQRMKSKEAFAMLCGVAPIPASSGSTSGRVRLNPGGNRRANRALHSIAVVRMKCDPRTQAYIARRCGGSNPLTKKEALRCVKLYVSREIFRALTHPFDVTERIDGDSLRAARKEAGLSQTQVAETLGVSKGSISLVELGKDCGGRMAERYLQWVLDGMPTEVEQSQRSA